MKKNAITLNEEEPKFDLRVENELLIMKLKAEFGAECATGSQELPPVVVNEFLKSVYEFEQKFRQPKKRVTIYEKIGRLPFIYADKLGDKQLGKELKKILKAMHSHQLELDVLGDYDSRIIYRFITEEFFAFEMEDIDMPGFIHHFCYEEFHPNHEMDIRNRAIEFITQWVQRKINEYSWELDMQFVHPDTRTFTRESIVKRINDLFDSYHSFCNHEYSIKKIIFNWDEDKQCGDGYVEGAAKYDAVTDDGETVHYQGDFRFYLANNNNWWSIYYFVFPGFSWNF